MHKSKKSRGNVTVPCDWAHFADYQWRVQASLGVRVPFLEVQTKTEVPYYAISIMVLKAPFSLSHTSQNNKNVFQKHFQAENCKWKFIVCQYWPLCESHSACWFDSVVRFRVFGIPAKVRGQDGPLCCSDESREQRKVSHRHVASTWEYGSRIWILKLFIIAVLFWKKHKKKGGLPNEQRVKQVQQQPLSSIWAHRRHVKVNQTQRVMTRLVQHRRDSDNTL